MLKYLWILAVALPTPSTGASSTPTMSNDISCMQAALTDLQYDPGEINGVISEQTRRAAEAAQADFQVSREVPPLNFYTARRWCTDLETHRYPASPSQQLVYITDLPVDDIILRGVRSGVDAARAVLNVDVPARAYVYEGTDLLIAATRKEMKVGAGAAKRMWLSIEGHAVYGAMIVSVEEIKKENDPSLRAFWVGAHEYAHLATSDLSGRGLPDDGPFWLAEGLAETIAARALALRGWWNTWDDVQARLTLLVEKKRGRAKQILRTLETAPSTKWLPIKSYDISHLAVDMLTRKTSFQKVATDYWKRRAEHRRDESWRTTFNKVFGMSVGAFYSTFDREVLPEAQ